MFTINKISSFKFVKEKLIVQDDKGYELCAFDGPLAEAAAVMFVNTLNKMKEQNDVQSNGS